MMELVPVIKAIFEAGAYFAAAFTVILVAGTLAGTCLSSQISRQEESPHHGVEP